MLLNIPGVKYRGPKLSSPNPAHWGRYQLSPIEAILALFGWKIEVINYMDTKYV